jgi:23S rRNA (guanine745-N1)-methyltransferase
VTAVLRCPHCHGRLARHERTWRCDEGHAFDVARQGYVNLTAGRPVHGGDTAEMLEARTAVLDAGHLDVVTDAVVDACRDALPAGALVEVGAGTAHHLAALRRALGERAGAGERPAVAIDASVAAGKRAARHPGVIAVVADAWAPWPLLDGVAAAVLTIFAPRNMPEAERVLAPGGQLLVVTPGGDHLVELRAPLGLLGIEEGKVERLREQAGGHLDLLGSHEVGTVRTLRRHDVLAMAAMGPSGHHHDQEELAARVARLPESMPVTVAVHLTRFTPRPTPT